MNHATSMKTKYRPSSRCIHRNRLCCSGFSSHPSSGKNSTCALWLPRPHCPRHALRTMLISPFRYMAQRQERPVRMPLCPSVSDFDLTGLTLSDRLSDSRLQLVALDRMCALPLTGQLRPRCQSLFSKRKHSSIYVLE